MGNRSLPPQTHGPTRTNTDPHGRGQTRSASKIHIPSGMWDRRPRRSLYFHRSRVSRMAHASLPRKLQKPGVSPSVLVRVGPCATVSLVTPLHFHRLRVSRMAHASLPRKFPSAMGLAGRLPRGELVRCGTGALAGHSKPGTRCRATSNECPSRWHEHHVHDYLETCGRKSGSVRRPAAAIGKTFAPRPYFSGSRNSRPSPAARDTCRPSISGLSSMTGAMSPLRLSTSSTCSAGTSNATVGQAV